MALKKFEYKIYCMYGAANRPLSICENSAQLTVGPRGHKQKKLNEHVFSFLLLSSSRPWYQAEFYYINISVVINSLNTFDIVSLSQLFFYLGLF